MYDKMNKYRNCGVREYWVIDYDHEKILKYNFERDGEITMYTQTDKIPVNIYSENEEGLVIDFGEIKEYIESIFGEEKLKSIL
jgi:Uma2 family endonuclease